MFWFNCFLFNTSLPVYQFQTTSLCLFTSYCALAFPCYMVVFLSFNQTAHCKYKDNNTEVWLVFRKKENQEKINNFCAERIYRRYFVGCYFCQILNWQTGTLLPCLVQFLWFLCCFYWRTTEPQYHNEENLPINLLSYIMSADTVFFGISLTSTLSRWGKTTITLLTQTYENKHEVQKTLIFWLYTYRVGINCSNQAKRYDGNLHSVKDPQEVMNTGIHCWSAPSWRKRDYKMLLILQNQRNVQ